MNSIKLTEKLHVLNAELFLSQRPLLQCDPLKRAERPATARVEAPGPLESLPAPSPGPCTQRVFCGITLLRHLSGVLLKFQLGHSSYLYMKSTTS